MKNEQKNNKTRNNGCNRYTSSNGLYYSYDNARSRSIKSAFWRYSNEFAGGRFDTLTSWRHS
jgi:hypothetical protein